MRSAGRYTQGLTRKSASKGSVSSEFPPFDLNTHGMAPHNGGPRQRDSSTGDASYARVCWKQRLGLIGSADVDQNSLTGPRRQKREEMRRGGSMDDALKVDH